MIESHRQRMIRRCRSASGALKCRLDAFFDQLGQASLIYNPPSPIINEKRCIECRLSGSDLHIAQGPRNFPSVNPPDMTSTVLLSSAMQSPECADGEGAYGLLDGAFRYQAFLPGFEVRAPFARRPAGRSSSSCSISPHCLILHRLDCPAHRKALCQIDIADQRMRSSSESVQNYALRI